MPGNYQMHATDDDGLGGCIVYSILFFICLIGFLAMMGVNI